MIIVRLLSTRAFWLVWHHQAYSGTGAGVVMESISPITPPLGLKVGSCGNIMESSSLRRSLGVLSSGNGCCRAFRICMLFGRSRHRLVQDHSSDRIPVPED